jgi:hypothetical protein
MKQCVNFPKMRDMKSQIFYPIVHAIALILLAFTSACGSQTEAPAPTPPVSGEQKIENKGGAAQTKSDDDEDDDEKDEDNKGGEGKKEDDEKEDKD